MERLKVSIGRTYNLGNYESLRLDTGLESELRDGELTYQEGFDRCRAAAEAALDQLEKVWMGRGVTLSAYRRTG